MLECFWEILERCLFNNRRVIRPFAIIGQRGQHADDNTLDAQEPVENFFGNALVDGRNQSVERLKFVRDGLLSGQCERFSAVTRREA